LLSKEYFSVDDTIIEPLASLKNYQTKNEEKISSERGRNPTVETFEVRRAAGTQHEPKTDPDTLQYKKSAGTATKLSYLGHLLIENRHGLVIGYPGNPSDRHHRT
jgi:hypothetical protein